MAARDRGPPISNDNNEVDMWWVPCCEGPWLHQDGTPEERGIRIKHLDLMSGLFTDHTVV